MIRLKGNIHKFDGNNIPYSTVAFIRLHLNKERNKETRPVNSIEYNYKKGQLTYL